MPRWVKTTKEVYYAIYNAHKRDLRVFESYTNIGGSDGQERRMLTGWGFAGSKNSLILSDIVGEGESLVESYFIVGVVEEDD